MHSNIPNCPYCDEGMVRLDDGTREVCKECRGTGKNLVGNFRTEKETPSCPNCGGGGYVDGPDPHNPLTLPGHTYRCSVCDGLGKVDGCRGTEKESSSCPDCGGSGEKEFCNAGIYYYSPCTKCGSTGVSKDESFGTD